MRWRFSATLILIFRSELTDLIFFVDWRLSTMAIRHQKTKSKPKASETSPRSFCNQGTMVIHLSRLKSGSYTSLCPPVYSTNEIDAFNVIR